MKTKLLTICLLLFSSQVFAEECKGNDVSKWNNCQGTYTWPSGKKYVGAWKNEKRHGQGTMTWKSGDKYVGEYENGKRHGQGTYTWLDGNKYVGAWKNGKRNGQGTMTWLDGDKYVGAWKNGKQHGQGTYTWLDGKKYVGAWKNEKRNGQGTMTWLDGDKYVGAWKNGKQHGQGTYTWLDGKKYVGAWKNDERFTKTMPFWLYFLLSLSITNMILGKNELQILRGNFKLGIQPKINPHHNGRLYIAITFFPLALSNYLTLADRGLNEVIFGFTLTFIPAGLVAYSLGYIIRKINMPKALKWKF